MIIIGIIFVLLGIWGGVFTIRNSKNMPPSVFGISRAKYQIVNKEKFNNVMIKQGYTFSIYCIVLGSFFIFTGNFESISLASTIIFTNVIYRFISKRYIKIIK